MKEKTPYDLLMEYERSRRPKRATQPLKRSRIKPKRREKKTLWRTGQVKIDSKGMARLRADAYHRSGGMCECGCGKTVAYSYDHLHHVIARSHGGSDTLENVKFITRACHKKIHGEPEWSRPLLPDFAEIFHYKKPPVSEHSGSLNSADSASGGTSKQAAGEIR